MKGLAQFGLVPVAYATLLTVVGSYKSPKDKIARMEKSGQLIRLKKGLYIVVPSTHQLPISKALVANHLYGPSYISFESALANYQMIPERVPLTKSMTPKRSKFFSTALGDFEYISTSFKYFEIGIRQELIHHQYAFLIATPEKALCDLIIATSGLRLQSVKAIQTFLEEDLRIDTTKLQTFNLEIIKECIAHGKKKGALTMLYNYLKR